MIHVGPAGWSYPDWEGPVYSRPRPVGFQPLPFLAQFFSCLEVNSTFYAQPRSANVARWVELLRPYPGFRFLVKLNRVFSHEPVPEDPQLWEQAAGEFEAGLLPLTRSRKLAGLLLQFPATFHHGLRSMGRLAHVRRLFEDQSLILEVRHQSWFVPPALAEIRGLGYHLANIDLPSSWDHPPALHGSASSIGYLRLHGRNSDQWFRSDAGRDDRYNYLYSPPEIGELAKRTRQIAAQSDETYVITNNHFAGQAVANALELRYLLERKPPDAPADLRRAFPHLREVTRQVGQGNLFDEPDA